ncbi:uncoupling protein [Seminavis robusta]|uniref:Uncoupling protein n=1 Tax=Seminavis robusta TaxID=568900 RepID=A0A9N8DQB4_9STRA|nr:uncoupling protein [Seminavis robusta]|eukprot:Sro276_g105950.1 uncoupling protein (390) ;mRNA; r:25718-27066
MPDITVLKEMLAAGPGCAIANGFLNGFETTKVKLQLHSQQHANGAGNISQSHHHHVAHNKPTMMPMTAGHTATNVTSTRMLHTPRPAASVVYPNATMVGVMTQIAREEGIVRGLLTPGLSASLTRSMLYGAYRVGLYPTIRDKVGQWSNNESSKNSATLIRNRILSGMITGGLGSMLSCPLDVVRTRLQADAGVIMAKSISCKNPSIPPLYYATGLRQGQPVRYSGMVSALMTIWRDEGLSQGLYRGASVTIARACVLNGAQLASYDTMKQYALARGRQQQTHANGSQWAQEGPLLHVTCAFLSGVLAQTVIMPIDTVKSHMMLGKGWNDVMNNVGRLLSPDGRTVHPLQLCKWMYRGWLPACTGQGLIMVLQMPLIEAFRRKLGVAAI